VLGASSLVVTLAAWMVSTDHNESETGNVPLALTLLSVLTTTILSIHSSWYMLEQSPHQSTILDCKLELLRSNSSVASTTKKRDDPRSESASNSFRLRVVAPHRGAFHRTSIIMQYANSRIILLLQRKHWYDEASSSSSSFSASGILAWGLVVVMCLRMILGEKLQSLAVWIRGGSSKKSASETKTKPTTKPTTTLKPLPPFWRNGNTYCFVLPMIASVCADCAMSAWCEARYFSLSSSGAKSSPSPLSLFGYFSEHWLSLWHLLFLQVVAHAIAFSFTLAFRIKHHNGKKKDDDHESSSGETYFSKPVRKFYNIKTLYWTCTLGVYALVAIGLIKAGSTLRVLG
jgi:hypothetical protein